VIVVGGILAMVLLGVLFLWIYKGRWVWNEMKAKETSRIMEDGLNNLGNLKEDVKDLKLRMEVVEGGGVGRIELGAGHRASDASFELPSPTTGGERQRLPSIPARVEQ